MNYEVGMTLKYVPDSKFDREEVVTVTGIRKRGQAKLSNGWVVDEFGVAERNCCFSGGHVEKLI